jgi:hypothetical protein
MLLRHCFAKRVSKSAFGRQRGISWDTVDRLYP